MRESFPDQKGSLKGTWKEERSLTFKMQYSIGGIRSLHAFFALKDKEENEESKAQQTIEGKAIRNV